MVNFRLNGEQVSTDAPVDTPLLWVIRDYFKLKGSKFGCGMGLCGACTMHIDGQASRTCILPLSAVIDKDVKTIEGLGTPDSLHRLQQAWLTHNVPQCGYCQPGQLMSASALLEQNPNPTDDDIDQAMSGNLCRCGTYPRIKKAIKDVALAQHKSTSAVSHFDPSVDQRSFSLATNIADTSTVGSIKGDVA